MNDLRSCIERAPLLLTEGAVGQRLVREFGLKPDAHIDYAGMLYNAESRSALKTIYRQYLQIAEDEQLPLLLLTNTRRSNRERVRASAFSGKNIMRDYAEFLRDIAEAYRCDAYIGGMMGCKGDAYTGAGALTEREAMEFHAWQIEAFAAAPIDFFLAALMPAVSEIVGLSKLMSQINIPYIVSFMIIRKGILPDGHSIREAIEMIDAQVSPAPLCYITNCVHPEIAREALMQSMNDAECVRRRFLGIQANAAYMLPQELDNRSELASSDAEKLAQAFDALYRDFPFKIAGGCCGTNEKHIAAIAAHMKQNVDISIKR